jgi:hypothetical protein
MKRIVVVTLLAATVFGFSSCRKVIGEGPLVTELRPVGSFTGISSEMSGRVNFTVGPDCKVELTAQGNILDVLQTNVVNGVLHIDFKNGVRVKAHEDMTIRVTAPAADYFRLSGSGDMDVQGDIVANNLQLKLSGSGNIDMQKAIIAGKIDAEMSGSGNISIMSGSAINEDLAISGSGKINMGGVAAQNAITHTSGSGDMRVMVSEKLDARISGSGSVYYRGNPIISMQVSGSGRVAPF